jgi:hypothetical protein
MKANNLEEDKYIMIERKSTNVFVWRMAANREGEREYCLRDESWDGYM